ncbi:MAG: DUF444 family protein [Parvularculaceae bacterium]
MRNSKRWRRKPPGHAIDPLDLRYNAYEPTPVETTAAVMFCLMDVSGSMGELWGSGGTVVSTALEKMLEVQKDRFPAHEWNIYVAQASTASAVG